MGKKPIAEDRRAVSITVAWMLCIFATIVADVLGLGGNFLLRWMAAGQEVPERLWLFPGLMLFTAFGTGLCAVLLIPFVYRFRTTPPPLAITITAVAAFAIPLITVV